MPDKKLVHAIEKVLSEDERTKELVSIHVNVVGGVVFLDGEVESADQRDIVIEAIKTVEGVKMVRNRMQLNPEARAGGWEEPHHHEGKS